MLLYEPRRLKSHGHVFEIYVIATNRYHLPEAQKVDGAEKGITGQSDGGLTLRIRRSVIYGEVAKADFLDETEMKIVEAKGPTTSTAKSTIIAMITTRNNTTNAGIGITIGATVDVVRLSQMSTTGAVQGIVGKVGHDIDLDHARQHQT